MAKRKSGGGSIVMVVFLIFFILLSIGLGVATYLGLSQDDSKDKALAAEKKKTTDLTQDLDWYKFQAESYRIAMGHTQGVALDKWANDRDRFDKGALTKKEEPEVKTLITTVLDPKLGWDKDQKRWKSNYEELLTAEKNKTDLAKKASQNFQAQQENEKKRADNLDEQLTKAKTDYDMQLTQFQNKATADLANLLAANQQLKNDKETLSKQIDAKALADQDDKRLVAKALKEKEDAITAIRSQLQKKTIVLEDLKRELGRDVPAATRTEWKIVRIDSRGETAYINLGSADKVQPQLTFRVYGLGPDGRTLPKDKATLEVMSVLGPHLSQAKINYVTTPRENPRHDQTHNPVVTGDVLINPSWNPNQKRHIALAGVVDLTGSGHDETAQFVRSLEKQGIVVDAYLDLHKDFTIKGPGITVQTDYLILGDSPTEVQGLAAGPAKDVKEKIAAGMAEMQKQAKDNGVRVRGLRQFLEEIGYRVPGNTDSKPATIDPRSGAGELPPALPKEPLKKDDKPLPPADR